MIDLTSHQLNKSQTALGLSYDDSGITKPQSIFTKQKKTLKSIDDNEIHLYHTPNIILPSDFNPLPTKIITNRSISISKKQTLNELQQVISHYNQLNIPTQQTCLQHPYGIIGLITAKHPHLAYMLCHHRLNALIEDSMKWWSKTNSQKAQQQLQKSKELLTKGDLIPCIESIATFEQQHNKVSFIKQLNTQFINNSETISESTLFSSKKNGLLNNLTNDIHSEKLIQNIQENINSSQQVLSQHIINFQKVHPNPTTNPEVLTKYLILEDPKQTKQHLILQCLFGINSFKQKQKKTSLSDEEKSDLSSLHQQLKTLNSINNRSQLTDFLNDKNNIELKTSIEQIVLESYINILHEKIINTDPSHIKQEQLNQLSFQADCTIKLINSYKKLKVSDTKELHELNTIEQNVQAFKKVNTINELLEKEKLNPKEERLFKLPPPNIARLIKVLSTQEPSIEYQLYQSIHSTLEASILFHDQTNDINLKNLRCHRFHLYRLHQDQVEFEIRVKIEDKNYPIQTTSGNFDTDVQTLKDIHQIRQKNTPKNLENGSKSAQFLKYVFWQNERTINQIIADIHQTKTLKELNYSMGSEMLSLISNVDQSNRENLQESAKKILAPTRAVIEKWRQGQGSIWNIFQLKSKTHQALEKETRNIIANVLDVAQRNPMQFRQCFGDISLVINQLYCLVGYQDHGLITQLKDTLTAQSAAYCFSGDQIELTPIELDSQLANNIKRFQLICDIAELSLHGTIITNVAKNIFTGKTDNILGCIGAGVSSFFFGLSAAPIGMAVMGSVWQIGSVLSSAAGTYAIRNATHQLNGEQIKLMNSIVSYGPMFLAATSPYDKAAELLRNFAKGDSIPTAIARSVLSPIIAPFSHLYSAIKNVYHGEPGSWKQLGIEIAICTSLIALTAAAAASVYALGFIAIAGSAIIGTICTGILIHYSLSKGLDKIRSFVLVTNDLLKNITNYIFDEDDKFYQTIKKDCQKEAKKLVELMNQKQLLDQSIIEEKSILLYQKYWSKLIGKKPEVATQFEQEADLSLLNTKTARTELAGQVHNSIQAVNIIKTAIKEYDSFIQSEDELNKLKTNLNDLGISIQESPIATLRWTLQALKEEQEAIILAQCHTENPGDSIETIEKTLFNHYKSMILGDKLPDIFNLTNKKLTKITDTAREIVKEKTQQVATKNYEQRSKILINTAINKTLQHYKETGKNLTEDQINNSETRQLIALEIEQQKLLIQQSTQEQLNTYKTKLEDTGFLQPLSRSEKLDFFDNVLKISDLD